MIGDGGHARVIRSFYGGDCIIAIGDNRVRKEFALQFPEQWYMTAVHPRAFVADDVMIGQGTVVMAGAIIQPGARIGCHVIVNSGATIDHDCVLEDFVHIAPGAHLCGNVHVGEGTLVGVGVGIAPNTTIPAWSLVKARRLEIEPL